MGKFEETKRNMRDLVLGSKPISMEDFEVILLEHDKFIITGGAGGRWETFYIKNLIFGTYVGASSSSGKQAKLGFNSLGNINLESIDLSYADCAGILAQNKNWQNADLEGTLFIDSVLTDCSFENADLQAADFSRSDLKNCNFRGATLIKTDFENCDLTGSDFTGATYDESTVFKNAILDNVIGLN